MDEERYFLFNKEDDFPQMSLEGLVFRDGKLTLERDTFSGHFLSCLMDSSEDGCHWRRARIGTVLAQGVEITFYVADGQYESMSDILQEDISISEKLQKLEGFKKFVIKGARDFLIRGVKGRFLAICAELSRNGGAEPELSFLQIWCREEPPVKYLPEIYHGEDSFTDRYLRLFGSQYLELENGLRWLQEHFDPLTASDLELRRLAGLLNIEHARLWDTKRLRKLLAEGVYREKGSFAGLKRLLEIYTDDAALIAERFRMKTGIEENDALYTDSELTILLTGSESCGFRTLRSLHLIIQWFLPVGVDYSLIALQDCVVLSGHTYLGINSRASDYAPAVLDGQDGLQYVVLKE